MHRGAFSAGGGDIGKWTTIVLIVHLTIEKRNPSQFQLTQVPSLQSERHHAVGAQNLREVLQMDNGVLHDEKKIAHLSGSGEVLPFFENPASALQKQAVVVGGSGSIFSIGGAECCHRRHDFRGNLGRFIRFQKVFQSAEAGVVLQFSSHTLTASGFGNAVKRKQNDSIGAMKPTIDLNHLRTTAHRFLRVPDVGFLCASEDDVQQVVAEEAAVLAFDEKREMVGVGRGSEDGSTFEGGSQMGGGAVFTHRVCGHKTQMGGAGETKGCVPQRTFHGACFILQRLLHRLLPNGKRVRRDFVTEQSFNERSTQQLSEVLLRQCLGTYGFHLLPGSFGQILRHRSLNSFPKRLETLGTKRSGQQKRKGKEKKDAFHKNICSEVRHTATLFSLPHTRNERLIVAKATDESEEYDKKGFDAVADEGKRLRHGFLHGIAERERFDYGKMPGTGSGGCGKKHANARSGEDVNEIGGADVFQTGEAGHKHKHL